MKNIILVVFVAVLVPILAIGQSTTKNYVRTKTYKKPFSTSQSSPTIEEVAQDITYFDGLGRPIQKIANKQSGEGKNIVTHLAYDHIGRQKKEYLPWVSLMDGLNFESANIPEELAFQYDGYYGDSIAYSEKQFDNSPLNRVLKQSAPGKDWKMGGGHEIQTDLRFNEEMEARFYKVTTSWNSSMWCYEPTLNDLGHYDADKLYKTVTTDENGIKAEEFKNNEGKVLLKRHYDATSPRDTYYVYDDFGNLTYVLPPIVDFDDTITQNTLDNLCYQYKYDHRNRLVEKKLPGKQWEYIAYNGMNMPVATGPVLDPFGTNEEGWLVTKYDPHGRVAYTLWYKEKSFSSELRLTFENNLLGGWAEEYQASPTTVDGKALNYTNNTYPYNSYKLLTINYYDNYTYAGAPTPGSVNGVPIHTTPKGLSTGSWIRVLENPSAPPVGNLTYIFYDVKGRPMRNHTTNYKGGYTTTDTDLDFTGKVKSTSTEHKMPLNEVVYISDKYNYSDQERLEDYSHKINNLPIEMISNKNIYDMFGQLISKDVGGNSTMHLQEVNYSYNIRGWMTGINHDKSNPGVLNTVDNDLFLFKINYNIAEDDVSGQVSPLYNGNISETFWRSKTDDVYRKYGYQYDTMNRLTNSYYQKPELTNPVTNMYNESMSYDHNGNITGLQRNGDFDSNIYGAHEIDDLVYDYDTDKKNQLVKVTDLSLSPKGFKDDSGSGSPTGKDYEYDANGNMTRDDNKDITEITYNHLNLPVKVQFGSGDKIEYLYDAAGQKKHKKVTEGINVFTTDYADGGFQYQNNILSFFPHIEGYVKVTLCSICQTGHQNMFNYVYQYKDHLGNIRLSYGLDDEEVKVIEEHHYYPFGLKHEKYNSGSKKYEMDPEFQGKAVLNPVEPGADVMNKYMYNGKELQDELSLNWYDYGARNYDPAIGRWMNYDPKAETSRRFSPYTYCLNNPVFFIDPDGMEAVDSEGWIEHTDSAGKQSVTFDAAVDTKKQAEAKGYTGVKQVLSEAKVTNKVNGDNIALNKDGTYSVNGGDAVHPFDKSYTAGGANINENKSALSQLAPVLSDSGDAAVLAGTAMVLTGFLSPIGAALITYGGAVSTTGTVMDIADDINNPNVTSSQVVEKSLTKYAVSKVPGLATKGLNKIYGPAANEIVKKSGILPAAAAVNASAIGADRLLDEFRTAGVGPYRKN